MTRSFFFCFFTNYKNNRDETIRPPWTSWTLGHFACKTRKCKTLQILCNNTYLLLTYYCSCYNMKVRERFSRSFICTETENKFICKNFCCGKYLSVIYYVIYSILKLLNRISQCQGLLEFKYFLKNSIFLIF